jgi:curved DNA-binding protein CbpA
LARAEVYSTRPLSGLTGASPPRNIEWTSKKSEATGETAMAGRDLYAVLGINTGADLPTIKRAYRRLVFSINDIGTTPDRKRFFEIHEAYEILTDPERRRSGTRAPAEQIYRRQMVVEPDPFSVGRRAVRVPDDFATTMPSIGELLDHVAQNFFGFHRKSHGPYRRLGIE